MASLFDAVERPRVIINTNDFNKPKSLADAIEKPVAEVPSEGIPNHHKSILQSTVDKLFGLHGEERYQLWPERLVRDAVSAPHNVMTGQIPTHEVDPVTGEVHTSSGLIKAAQDVSALAGTGGLAGAGKEAGMALGSGPLKNDLIAAAKNHFGLTSNPKEAGYVMPDGSMLDFSGRHYADYVKQGDRFVPQKGTDYLRDQRNVDHRELHDIMETPVNEMTGRLDNNLMLSKFMNDAGAIRNQPGVGFETSVIPTNKQLKALVAGHNSSYRGQPLKVDLSSPSGEVYASFDFNRPNIEGVKNWISSNFKELKSDNEAGLGIGVLAQTNKPFYSAVENAVAAAKQPKADVQQWLSFLKNQPGVKQEELAHLGLDKLSGSITKDDLLKAVQEGQPQIKEVIKGTEKGPFGNAAYDAANNFSHEMHKKYGNGWRLKASKEELDRLDDLEARGEMKNPNPTKYQDYQLPGGENYREMLLTLPSKKVTEITPEQFRAGAIRLYGEKYADSLSPAQQEIVRRNLRGEHDGTTANDYRSSHWDEPNVLAHIRMNDRMIDGKKSLHLEEIQSDWHQAGRKKGYEPDRKQAMSKVQDLIKEASALSTSDPRYKEIYKELPEWQAKANERSVPDAPFKKTWDELALKKAITEAVKNGYDSISWTPGEAQAARYDLSKHLDSIGYEKRSDNLYNVTARGKNNNTVWNNQSATLEQIESHLGKEMAEKIKNGHGDKQGKFKFLTDLDLKVGGQGMKAFYDKMLVDKANALVKKYKGKVEKSKAGDHDVHVLKITPELREHVLKKGFPLFSAGVPVFNPVDHNPFEEKK